MAYEHVPLVEANPLAGLANNVVSNRVVCVARRCGAAQVVLISTDKAVRTSNVLQSFGSVMPLFRPQIADGGPIILNHPGK